MTAQSGTLILVQPSAASDRARALSNTSDYSLQLAQSRRLTYNDINNTALVHFASPPHHTKENILNFDHVPVSTNGDNGCNADVKDASLKNPSKRPTVFKPKEFSTPNISQTSLILNRENYKRYLKSKRNIVSDPLNEFLASKSQYSLSSSKFSHSSRPRRSSGVYQKSFVDNANDESDDITTETSGENSEASSSEFVAQHMQRCPWCPPGIFPTDNEIINCSKCNRMGHPKCLNFNENMLKSVRIYDWLCVDCKTCSICETMDQSETTNNEILLCDNCDRGYHFGCIYPRLEKLPEGDWHCILCSVP